MARMRGWSSRGGAPSASDAVADPGSSHWVGARPIGALAVLIIGLLMVSSAKAAPPEPGGKHVFDPLLSLTGSASATSTLDPVPDPPPNHPSTSFFELLGVAVDSEGDVYVSGNGHAATEGAIDIFNASGQFILEIPNEDGPQEVAVDGLGNLYVSEGTVSPPQRVVRYSPSEYPPTSNTTYASPVVVDPFTEPEQGVAVNPSDNNLLVVHASAVSEYSSAATGNTLIRSDIGEGKLKNAKGIAVDAAGDMFVGSTTEGKSEIPTRSEPFVSSVYIFDSTGALKGTVSGSDTPAGGFASDFGKVYVAVDDATGELFVSDGVGAEKVYRFVSSGDGDYRYVADPELESHSYSGGSLHLAVSNAAGLPNSDYVYVTSANKEPPANLSAFGPQGETGPPLVKDAEASNITGTDATLSAEILPHGFPTSYRFQYVDDAQYEANGFADAANVPAVPRPIGEGELYVPVSQQISGLQPGSTYHFRVLAENCGIANPNGCVAEGEAGEGGAGEIPHFFATFPIAPTQSACPNSAFRVGPSAQLPDCRAYELVSPPGSGGRAVLADALGALSSGFATSLAGANGESVVFESSSAGPLPGMEANGFNDQYVARRSSAGWSTAHESPTGSQMQVPSPGGVSADHGYSFWRTGGGKGTPDSGSLVLGAETEYLRAPDGSFHLLGTGGEGTDPEASGRWIAADGAHVIFTSAVHLEQGAPPNGIEGIYDRTPDGLLHVVSLLPGNIAPGAGVTVTYLGVSADGSTVAFTVTAGSVTTLYLRVDDAETIPVKTGAIVYGGLSSNGSRLTYLDSGHIFSFDAESHDSEPVGTAGGSTLVNVSDDGSHVYFVSPRVLTQAGGPQAGQQNFYVWDAMTQAVRFIAVLTSLDVEGEPVQLGSSVHGLGLWTSSVVSPTATSFNGPGNDPSRTSPDGRYIVFESHADLTGYDANGRPEVFRYDSGTGQLQCVSCNPTFARASAGAWLQSLHAEAGSVAGKEAPINSFAVVDNLVDDGGMVFFETTESLVADDSNSSLDVYEWEANGVGGCQRLDGCVSLISAGRGSRASYLYGADESGRDVFFLSGDALVPGADAEGVALYGARIGGGFPAPTEKTECRLDSCQSSIVPPPAPPASSSEVVGPGNVPRGRKCKRDRHKVKRHGKFRCEKKRRHHKRANHRSGHRTGRSGHRWDHKGGAK